MEVNSNLTSLPYQLLVDNVLSRLDLITLVGLRSVCKALLAAVDDQVLWRRRIADDYHFPVETATARQTGWQDLYRGLSKPEVYVWGDTSNDRLGSEWRREGHLRVLWQKCRGIPIPIALNMTSPHHFRADSGRIVEGGSPSELPHQRDKADVGVPVQLHAGGWSFFALTNKGHILAWGSANERHEATSDRAYSSFAHPTCLDMGDARASQLSVGRSSLVALMRDGNVWQWHDTWDKIHRLNLSSLISRAGLERHELSASSSLVSSRFSVIQVEAGWDFTVLLIREVPLQVGHSAGASASHRDGDEEEEGKRVRTHLVMWDIDWIPTGRNVNEEQGVVDLPVVALPPLPEQIVKVAAGENFVVALSQSGMVYHLSLASTRDPDQLRVLVSTRSHRLEWKFMPRFCIPDEIRASGAIGAVSEVDSGEEDVSDSETDSFDDAKGAVGRATGSRNIWKMASYKHLLTDKTKITHITAQFRSFAVYAPDSGGEQSCDYSDGMRPSKGVVLLGSSDATTDSHATVHPGLQGQEVIKVTHGDWHTGALTKDGRVLAWGAWSNGALGTWDSIPHHPNATSLLSRNDFYASGNANEAISAAATASSRSRTASTRGTGIFRRLQESARHFVSPIAERHGQNEDISEEREAGGDPPIRAPGEIPRSQGEVEEEHSNRILEHRIMRQQQQASLDETDNRSEAGEEGPRKHEYWMRRVTQRLIPHRPTKRPTQVRFGFQHFHAWSEGSSSQPLDDTAIVEEEGDETKYVFDLAFAGWHSGALAIDKKLLGTEPMLQPAMV